MASHKWSPIEDLPPGWAEFRLPHTERLAERWLRRRERLAQLGKSEEFDAGFGERLRRRWSVETGQIEGVYFIDRGTTRVVIVEGFSTDALERRGAVDGDPATIRAILQDQCEALESLMDFVGGTRQLTTAYVKELHALFTRHHPSVQAFTPEGKQVEVELLRGEWKRLPNNPTRPDGDVHEYAPPEQVASEMDRLLAMHAQHTAAGVAPLLEAAWLHHRFVQIHPFQDGNGRMARALASLVLLRAGWMPFVVDRDTRVDYIAALERADDGDLGDLVRLMAGLEEEALLDALRESDALLPQDEALAERAEEARRRLGERWESLGGDSALYRRVVLLSAHALSVLNERSTALEAILREGDPTVICEVREASDELVRHWLGQSPAAPSEAAPLRVAQPLWQVTVQDCRSRLLVLFLGGATAQTQTVCAAAAAIIATPRHSGNLEKLYPETLGLAESTTRDEVGDWLQRALVWFTDEWTRRL